MEEHIATSKTSLESPTKLLTESEDIGKEWEFASGEKKRPTEKDDIREAATKNLEICEQNSSNSYNIELDYESDIVEKHTGSSKESAGDLTPQYNPDGEHIELEIHCEQDETDPAVAKDELTKNNLELKESSADEDKDEGELSDDDDFDGLSTAGNKNSEDGLVEDDLEEGEVKDAAPNNMRAPTRQVCRFFNNGNCLWGNQCRFLHLSLNGHGCYNMFAPNHKSIMPHNLPPLLPCNEMPLVLPPPPHHSPMNTEDRHLPPIFNKVSPPAPSAWDYGLQHAKERIELANQRKKQEVDYEEKKLNLSADESDRVTDHNKENYNYTKPPYHQEHDKAPFGKYDKQKNFRGKFQSRTPKVWNEQENNQGSFGRNKWREKQLSEIQTTRSRGDEWKDPWRRSKADGEKRNSRELSSCSSVSSRSYSSRSSSASYSSRTSSRSSRSPSRERTYHKTNAPEGNKRRKLSMDNQTVNPLPPYKEKPPLPHKIRRRSGSALSRQRDSSYRSRSASSRSRSRSVSHSQSLSDVSSASSYSSDSSEPTNRIARKNGAEPQNKKPTSSKPQPTRTLYEEMQRLQRYRELAIAKQTDDAQSMAVDTRSTGVDILEKKCIKVEPQEMQPEKKGKKRSLSKQPLSPESDKNRLEQMKSIGFRRIELMSQLKAVEDAIARKRAKFS